MNNLHVSPEAQSDLAEIKDYISKDLENPTAALSVLGKIIKAMRRLREYAWIGAPLSSTANVNSDYRFLVSGSYIVFYRVMDKDVFIDRVIYGRRDYLRILFGDMTDGELRE